MKCRHETPCSKRCLLGTGELKPCRGHDKCKEFQPNYTTNADRIRAMSDEELADFLGDWADRHLFWMCDSQGECLAWLKQPVKDGDNG